MQTAGRDAQVAHVIYLVVLFALFAALMGVGGLLRPRTLVAFGRGFAAGPGVWGGFAIRAVVAVALWLSAPESRTPGTFRVLAVLFALGAVMLPLMGSRRFEEIVEKGAHMPPWVLRAVSFLALVLGVFLFWSSFEGF